MGWCFPIYNLKQNTGFVGRVNIVHMKDWVTCGLIYINNGLKSFFKFFFNHVQMSLLCTNPNVV